MSALSVPVVIFQSTLSARRATNNVSIKRSSSNISIHALREESDMMRCSINCKYPQNFNPRSPRGERRGCFSGTIDRFLISIHALREESDRGFTFSRIRYFDFNPRSPRGERRLNSITLIRSEAFQSTLSARRATVSYCAGTSVTLISIHALREESDTHRSSLVYRVAYFNPRSPRGERPCLHDIHLRSLLFQSTLSARRATTKETVNAPAVKISIHALREESDGHGREPVALYRAISIHALREESDFTFTLSTSFFRFLFQSTLSARRATECF